MTKIYEAIDLINRRDALLRRLDNGILPVLEWQALLQDMKKAGLTAMHDHNKKRFDHYKKVWRGLTDENPEVS